MTASHQPPVTIVRRLAEALNDRDINYCHWKSNEAIAKSESAENDLDLLIAPDDVHKFRAVLSDTGFSRVERRTQPLPPGKEDFFGFDEETGRLVHVDAHYNLVLGHDRTKNHRIPIEAAYLRSSKRCGLFKLPAPEFEYLVFVVRMVLKYAVWDEILFERLRGRTASLKASETRELLDLEARIEVEKLNDLVATHTPWLSDGLLESCIAISRGQASIRRRLQTSRRIDTALASYMQQRPAVDAQLRIWRRLSFGIRRRLRGSGGFRPARGGAVLAIMGGDGSGKSTVVGELEGWLGDEFDVRRIHMGKPPWSTTTYGVRGALKFVALLGEVKQKRGWKCWPGLDHQYREPVWLACTARDRYLAFRKARGFANRGGLVISDRYPHSKLESMDVALIGRLSGVPQSGRLIERLREVERRYYERIDAPEFLAVLRVDPETAVARKTDEPSDYVRRRVAEVWAIDWADTSVHVVDADQPKEVVAADLKALIWDVVR